MEPVTFSSEEARAQAIDAFDEETGNLEDLEAIQNAEIVSSDGGQKGEAEETPADPNAGGGGQEVEPKQPEETPPPAEGEEEIFTIKRSELPEDLRTISSSGFLLKKLTEQESTIERQKKFIQERLSENPDERSGQLETRIQQLEAQLQTVGKADRASDSGQMSDDTKVDIGQIQSRINEIKKLKGSLSTKDQFDPDVIRERDRLDSLMIDAMNDMTGAIVHAQDEIAETRTRADRWLQGQQKTHEDEQRERAMREEFGQFDAFAKAHNGEYPLSKPAAEIEKDYLGWAYQVGRLYYSRQPKNDDEALYALNELQKRPPALVEACQAAGVALEPSQDVKSYLGICDLANYRDGVRYDPITGRQTQATRYHPKHGNIPDTLPSLDAAYEYQKINGGFYRQQVLEAERAGAQNAIKAMARGAGASEDLDNAGSHGGAPSQPMTNQGALDTLNRIDEIDAVARARNGDMSLLEELNQAYTALGMPTMQIG